MLERIRGFLSDEHGLTSVEYALMLTVVVVAAVAAWQQVGVSVANKANTVANALH
jgi:Flp pilus assembly pilin Flp